MYECIQVGEKSYYINCPAKIGIYKATEQGVYLIDSGNDKDAAKKVRKVLDEHGWKLLGIINTHSNADHIGGNRYLQTQTGCPVFVSGIEAAFTEHPILEPSFLYGGYPPKELRHKFLLADASEVTPVTDARFPSELQLIPLAGHFFDMVGVRTPDGTVFLADCLSSAATLEKYRVPFIYDVAAYLQTLDTVEAMEAPMFVPAHAEAVADIAPLARLNREKVGAVTEDICALLVRPMCFEELLKRLFDAYALTLNFEQYVLVGSTVRSFLAWLADNGRVTANFTENRLMWGIK